MIDHDEIVMDGRALDDLLALRARLDGRGETSQEEDVRWAAGELGWTLAKVRRVLGRGVRRRELGEVERVVRSGEVPRAWRVAKGGRGIEPAGDS